MKRISLKQARSNVQAVVVILLAGCATSPAPRPIDLDPANPAAAESPPLQLSPLVAAPELAEEPAAAPPATPPQPALPAPPEHQHDHFDAPVQPAAEAKPPANSDHTGHHGKASPPNAAVIFTCPMHPEVKSNQPGRCPKCGMKLVPDKTKAAK